MAVWQVDFHIVPLRALATAAQPLTPATLDDAQWWKRANFPRDYKARLGGVAVLGKSPRAELERWGEEDGNRIDVWSADGEVSTVTARVDVRRLDSKFGAALLAFVRAIGAVLVRQDGLVVQPTINAYSGALRSSTAWRYASDRERP